LTACDKNQETASGSVSEINAVVYDGNEYNDLIDVVKLFVDDVEVVKSDYRNGRFSINLPDNITNLKPFDIEFPPKVNISGKDILYANSRLFAYNKDEEQVGYFYYVYYKYETVEGEEHLLPEAEATLLYFNKSFTIIGTHAESDEWGTTNFIWDCNFKSGWNFLFHGNRPDWKGNRIDKTTTATPSGIKYWLFKANDDPC
jgi:hypothetical protein